MLLLVVSTFQSFPHFVYAGFAWSLVGLTIWNILAAIRKVTQQASRMHQIPCATCQFFTGSYDLKCTVHPQIAMTEEAIDCSDYTLSTFTVVTSGTPSKSPIPGKL
ncbi:hypothetical protein ACKFKG_13680 [Phormidesmis sp. 146-35]